MAELAWHFIKSSFLWGKKSHGIPVLFCVECLYKCNYNFFHLLQFRDVIAPLEEIPQWIKRHCLSFLNAVFKVSLEYIKEFRPYEKCKGILAELHRQQKKDERQTTIGNQILQRLTINVGVRNLDAVGDSILVRPRHEMARQRKIKSNWQKKKSRLLKWKHNRPPKLTASF